MSAGEVASSSISSTLSLVWEAKGRCAFFIFWMLDVCAAAVVLADSCPVVFLCPIALFAPAEGSMTPMPWSMLLSKRVNYYCAKKANVSWTFLLAIPTAIV